MSRTLTLLGSLALAAIGLAAGSRVEVDQASPAEASLGTSAAVIANVVPRLVPVPDGAMVDLGSVGARPAGVKSGR